LKFEKKYCFKCYSKKRKNFINFSKSNLIPNNDNIIKCKANQELNNYYTPNEFIYYDEDELFILLNENKDVSYNLSCKNESLGTNIPEPSTQNNRGYLSKTSGSNSTGMIVGIIAGVIALIAGIVLIVYCIYKKKVKNKKKNILRLNY